MNVKNEIHNQIKALGIKHFTIPALMKMLKLSGNLDYRYLSGIIKELVKDGKVLRVKNKYALANQQGKAAGDR